MQTRSTCISLPLGLSGTFRLSSAPLGPCSLYWQNLMGVATSSSILVQDCLQLQAAQLCQLLVHIPGQMGSCEQSSSHPESTGRNYTHLSGAHHMMVCLRPSCEINCTEGGHSWAELQQREGPSMLLRVSVADYQDLQATEASEAGQKQRTVGSLRSQQLGQGRLPLLLLEGQGACHPQSAYACASSAVLASPRADASSDSC